MKRANWASALKTSFCACPCARRSTANFYGFEPFTYCPIDTRPLVLSLMEEEELRWLNDYHAMVRAELEAFLTPEENAWLAEACAPVKK